MELSFWITNAFGRFYQKTARILPSSISGRGSICSGGDAMSMERFLNKVIFPKKNIAGREKKRNVSRLAGVVEKQVELID
jgi:hypothetical protein